MPGKIDPIGGCIRFYNAGPQWHINEAHITVGFDTTRQPEIIQVDGNGFRAGDLVIYMTEPRPVVNIYPKEDETMVTRGITAGGSGGVGNIKFRFYKDGFGQLFLNDPEHYKLLRGDTSNLWVGVNSWIETEEG